MDSPINNTNEIETDDAPLADVEPSFDYDVEEEDLIRELLAEGYTLEEATRMIGDGSDDDDDYGYGMDSLDRDVPDFGDDEDSE